MRHIKDIYPIVNEVRQRIIEKMRAENIVLVQFCPATEEEYLQEHEGEKDVQEYGDYRDEHCPYVIWFDKYNSGEDLCVMSVSFMDGEHPYFVLHCEGEYDGKDVCDDDVAWLTMLNVYESLEKHLELEDEPDEVWVLFDESLDDYSLAGRRIRVYKNEAEARKVFHETVGVTRKVRSAEGWEINEDEDFFEAYPDGSWGTSHETVELKKCKIGEEIWCHE